MKISIHTMINWPMKDANLYPFKEALKSFIELADEVIVVNGGEDVLPHEFIGESGGRMREVMLPWPEKWHWSELPLHLNAGFDACSGDWVIKCDSDYLFHEADIPTLKQALEEYQDWMAASIVKKVVLNRNHFMRKCEMPFCINKKLSGETIKYGIAENMHTDWCYPIYQIKGKTEQGAPIGLSLPEAIVRRTGVDVWDYDYFFRTKELSKSEFWRFSQAYATVFDWSWGATEDEAFRVFCNQANGRLQKRILPLAIESHPKFIREKVAAMTPDMFGYSNWNNLKDLL